MIVVLGGTVVALLVTAYAIVVGLLLGSFINLAADRVPRGESLLHPRSHCRACGRQLDAVDLLPVAGYLIRGGRCATCRAEIGLGAPLVELAAGCCVAAGIVWLGLWPGAVVGLAATGGFGVVVVARAVRRFRPEAEARSQL